MKVLEGIGSYHAELIEWYARAHFNEGRAEAIQAIAKAYKSEEGQAALWKNGSPLRGEGAPWSELWKIGSAM